MINLKKNELLYYDNNLISLYVIHKNFKPSLIDQFKLKQDSLKLLKFKKIRKKAQIFQFYKNLSLLIEEKKYRKKIKIFKKYNLNNRPLFKISNSIIKDNYNYYFAKISADTKDLLFVYNKNFKPIIDYPTIYNKTLLEKKYFNQLQEEKIK